MPGYQVQARVIFKILNNTTHRVPVDMDIKRRHKNTHLPAGAFKIFAFDYFLNHNHLPIAGGDDLAVTFMYRSGGYTEKLNYKQEDNNTTDQYKPGDPVAFRKEIVYT
jgi:hypothetical protein